jgi:cold shock protein
MIEGGCRIYVVLHRHDHLTGIGQMLSGTVKWFNMQRGYGFIGRDDGGPDVFVHISAVLAAGLPDLREGQTVEFEIEPAKNGKTAATNLKLR